MTHSVQSTAVSAHLGEANEPRGWITQDGQAVLSVGSDALPVSIFPASPAQLFLIGEEAKRLAVEWLDRQAARAAAADRAEHDAERFRLTLDETPATHRDDLNDDGLDQVAS